MERFECIFLEDACGPARPVDVESARPDEVRREFERFRIQGADVAVDPPRDDEVVGRNTIEVLPRQESPLGPFRFIPVDPKDPTAARRRSRGLAQSGDRILDGPGAGEPNPSAFARGIGHVGVGVDESRDDDSAVQVDAFRGAAHAPLYLRIRPDRDEPIFSHRKGLGPRPVGDRGEDLAVDEDDVCVAGHLSARPSGLAPGRSPPGGSRRASRT